MSKTGMLIAFFVLFGVMYGTYDLYDEYSAQREVGAVVLSISSQISSLSNAPEEYSVKKKIKLPGNIHGEPYIFTMDSERYHIKIKLMGKFSDKNIEEFAMLPDFLFVREGFNSKGEVSVGSPFEGMNTTGAIVVSKNYAVINITAVA